MWQMREINFDSHMISTPDWLWEVPVRVRVRVRVRVGVRVRVRVRATVRVKARVKLRVTYLLYLLTN